MALNNSQIVEVDIFKDIFLDLPIKRDNSLPPILVEESPIAKTRRVANLSLVEKKKAKKKLVVDRLNDSKRKSIA